NQPLADISEMRVVQGMDAGLYQKLKVVIWPSAIASRNASLSVDLINLADAALPSSMYPLSIAAISFVVNSRWMSLQRGCRR
ncbi:type II secretion system protein GspK, partial [Escherichia coli]|nr:type II secretion system protein GspK [Escherichia coli]